MMEFLARALCLLRKHQPLPLPGCSCGWMVSVLGIVVHRSCHVTCTGSGTAADVVGMTASALWSLFHGSPVAQTSGATLGADAVLVRVCSRTLDGNALARLAGAMSALAESTPQRRALVQQGVSHLFGVTDLCSAFCMARVAIGSDQPSQGPSEIIDTTCMMHFRHVKVADARDNAHAAAVGVADADFP